MVFGLINNSSIFGWIFLTILPSMYLYRKANIKLQYRSNNPVENIRIISSVHAIATSSISVIYLNNWTSLNYFSWAIGFLSYGFFLIDFSHILLYKHQYSKKLLYSYYLHHSLVLIALSCASRYPYLVARGYLSELSTPFINLSWLLHKHGVRGGYYLVNGIIVLLLFLFARLYNIGNLLYFRHESTIASDIILSLLFILNLVWTHGLSLIYYKDYKKFLKLT